MFFCDRRGFGNLMFSFRFAFITTKGVPVRQVISLNFETKGVPKRQVISLNFEMKGVPVHQVISLNFE